MPMSGSFDGTTERSQSQDSVETDIKPKNKTVTIDDSVDMH